MTGPSTLGASATRDASTRRWTLVEALLDLARERPGDPTTIFWDRDAPQVIARAELVDLARRHAAALAEVGVRPGDRVVIAWPNSPGFLGAFWGALLLGAAVVPVPPISSSRASASRERFLGVVGAARPAAVALPADAVERLGSVLTVPTVTGPSSRPDLVDVAPPDPDRIAIIQYTSGSTSAPKGCTLTHRQIVTDLVGAAERLGIDHVQHGVNWCPLHHDMGLVGSVMLPVWSGVLVAVQMQPEQFLRSPALWLRVMAAYEAEVSAIPGSALSLLARRIERRPIEADLSCIRSVFCGAEPLDPAAVERFLAAGAVSGLRPTALQPAYGLAEHVVIVTSRRDGLHVDEVSRSALGDGSARTPLPEEEAVRIVSLGTPIEGAEVRIVGADRVPVGERQVGQIEVRSEAVMHGYFGDPQSTASTIVDGWLRTGDLGYLAHGELYVTGRTKEVIISGGLNIHPFDVEQVVGSIDAVAIHAVAAIGVPASGTQDLVVVVESRSPLDEVVREVRRACTGRAGCVPREVVVVKPGSLPRTTSGKLQRVQICEQYLEQRLEVRVP